MLARAQGLAMTPFIEKGLQQLSVDEVAELLGRLGLKSFVQAFKKNEVSNIFVTS